MIVKDLRYVVDTIGKINSQIVSGEARMTADIREMHGFSILHGAVFLAKPELVIGLLRYGADPNAPCTMASPLIFARRLADLSKERAYCAKFLSRDRPDSGRSCLFARRIAYLGQEKSGANNSLTPSSNDAEFNLQYFEERAQNLKIICKELSKECYSAPRACASVQANLEQVANNEENSLTKHPAKGPHVDREEVALHLFLKSVNPYRQKDAPWRSMDEASSYFYAELGRKDIILFRAARTAATELGYVEWGKPDEDEDAWGLLEVAPSTDSCFNDEMKASFRTTKEGFTRLLHIPEYKSVLPPTEDRSCDQLSVTGNNSERHNSSDSRQKAPSHDTTLSVFLRSIEAAKSIDEEVGWVSMDAVKGSFYQQFGKVDVEVFEASRKRATAERLIQWGGIDEESFGGWTAIDPDEVENPNGACLTLSENGWDFLSSPSAATQVLQPATMSVPQKRCERLVDFLQCVARCDKDPNGWTKLHDLVASFSREYGKKGCGDDRATTISSLTPEIKRWCDEGLQEVCLIWGRPDESRPGIFEPCTRLQVVGHAIGPVLKLTGKGYAIATDPNALTDRAPIDWWKSNVEAGLRQQSYTEMAETNQQASKNPLQGEPGASAASSLSMATSIAPRGRGRGRTLPAWMTRKQLDEQDKQAGASIVTATSSVVRQQQLDSNDETLGLVAGSSCAYAGRNNKHRHNSTRFLPRHWFLPKKHTLCRHFLSATNPRCTFDHRCRFPHVQPPLSDDILQLYTGPMKTLSLSDFQFEGDGTLITAVYHDPQTKIYYTAQGGRRVNTCHDGNADSVCWYANQEDAIHAVTAVYAASQPHNTHRHQQHPSRDILNRPSKQQRR